MSKKLAILEADVAGIPSGAVTAASLSTLPGRLVVIGPATNPLAASPPVGEFLLLSAGGAAQTLALRADRTLFLNPVPGHAPPVPAALAGLPFCAVGMGRNHAMAIQPDGSIVAWPPAAAVGAPATGPFTAVTGAGGFLSIALDAAGGLVLWGGSGLSPADYLKSIGVGPPPGQFKAIAARARYVLALATDGTLYGWGTDSSPLLPPGTDFQVFTSLLAPWRKDGAGHFIAPIEPGNPYTAIAAGLDVVVALRADGRVVQWDPTGLIPDPPAGVFIQIAAGFGFAAGIDQYGQVRAWGRPGLSWVTDVPSGVYADVSAATGHITAIEVPRTSIWPPNHKMKTMSLTFRADENCTPVALADLSVMLQSNQPDKSYSSGNTTGDTNGGDGYSGPVVLPSSSVSQNADGSFTATFQLRAERATALPGPRVYRVAIVTTDASVPPNTRTRMAAQYVVEP